MSSRTTVTVSVAVALVDNPVPPAIVAVLPSVTAWGVPVSPANVQEVYPPGTAAQALSPLKNVLALAVPVAERSPVIVPDPVMVPPVISTKVPEDVATEVTVPVY